MLLNWKMPETNNLDAAEENEDSFRKAGNLSWMNKTGEKPWTDIFRLWMYGR